MAYSHHFSKFYYKDVYTNLLCQLVVYVEYVIKQLECGLVVNTRPKQ